MRLVKRLPIIVLASALTLPLAACGGEEGDGDGNPNECVTPEGDNFGYVLSLIDVPTSGAESDALGLDLDGDGRADNALGGILGALETGDVDIQAAIDEQVDTGGVIILANLQTTDLASSACAGLSVFLGDSPSNSPCIDENDLVCRGHLDGATSFGIAANSPRDALLTGPIVGGRLQAGPGTVTIELALIEGGAPLTLPLIGAQVEISTISDTGLMQGKLGGAIPEETLQTDLPAGIQAIVNDVIAGECDIAMAPNCCAEGSTGATVVGIFDTDDDCVISLTEVTENALIAGFLTPDVDLVGDDGVNDALSLGLGFSAVRGEFTP